MSLSSPLPGVHTVRFFSVGAYRSIGSWTTRDLGRVGKQAMRLVSDTYMVRGTKHSSPHSIHCTSGQTVSSPRSMQVERGPALCDVRRELEPGCDDVCYGIYYVRSVYIVYVAITLIMRIIPLSPLLPSSVVVFRPTSLPFSHPPPPPSSTPVTRWRACARDFLDLTLLSGSKRAHLECTGSGAPA